MRSLPDRPELAALEAEARALHRELGEARLPAAARIRAVEVADRWGRLAPYPRFDEAVAALDPGDLRLLAELFTADPGLVAARGEARLDEDPASIDRQLDQWSLPDSTPLHWAARLNRVPLAKRLLERGADPGILAGDGHTALEIAESKGATETAALLRAHLGPPGAG